MDRTARAIAERLVIETAMARDLPTIRRMVAAAYSKYVERLGRMPAALTTDFAEPVGTGNVHVLKADGRVVGSILLLHNGDIVTVENLVVDPSAQGRGFGRVLMESRKRRHACGDWPVSRFSPMWRRTRTSACTGSSASSRPWQLGGRV